MVAAVVGIMYGISSVWWLLLSAHLMLSVGEELRFMNGINVAMLTHSLVTKLDIKVK
jgi:hypothetical protein